MAYPIYPLKGYFPENHPLYFCDANVWIAILKSYGLGGVDKVESPYCDFFEAIINLNEINDPDAVKKIKNKPKIILTSLLLSEIINTYMRKVAMRAFFGGGESYKAYSFKDNYRDNPSSDYKKQIKTFVSDFKIFLGYTEIWDDNFKSLSAENLLSLMTSLPIDFNDLYFIQHLKDKNIPIVTHDKDFLSQDLFIITDNPSLLRKSTVHHK